MESTAPVVQLLRREAAAWESLLNLQSAVASATAKCSELSSTHDSPHSRAYLSSLTHLAACGDALVAEALKLRSLRHARDSIEHQIYRHVVADHQLELFKVGEATTRSMTANVLQVTAELRNDVARARTELTQLKAALEALDDVALRLPEATSVVVGLRRSAEVPAAEEAPAAAQSWADQCEEEEGNDSEPAAALPELTLQPVEAFLRACLAHSAGAGITAEALLAALTQAPVPDGAQRFRRRKS